MGEPPAKFAKIVPPGFKLGLGEALDTCPYNFFHTTLISKREAHVAKCRSAYLKKNYKPGYPVEFFTCKYSDLHSVPFVEIPWHQNRCPFKSEEFHLPPPPENVVEKPRHKKYSELSRAEVRELIRQIDDRLEIGEEDWDFEEYMKGRLSEGKPGPAFNPKNSILEKSIPWCPAGLTKSERREFRKLHSEARRIQRGIHTVDAGMDFEDMDIEETPPEKKAAPPAM